MSHLFHYIRMDSLRDLESTVARQEQWIIQLTAELAATVQLLVHERELADELRYIAAEANETLDALSRHLEDGH